MRIQMRLSQESEHILRNEKQDYLKKEDISVTYGWIVNQITKKMFPLAEKIDWKNVKLFQLKLVDDEKTNDFEYNTTLNLEQTAVNNIVAMQIMFKDIFKVARVHKAFVVRMVLRANHLINADEHIFKEEDDGCPSDLSH